jgi:hypothetical protein
MLTIQFFYNFFFHLIERDKKKRDGHCHSTGTLLLLNPFPTWTVEFKLDVMLLRTRRLKFTEKIYQPPLHKFHETYKVTFYRFSKLFYSPPLSSTSRLTDGDVLCGKTRKETVGVAGYISTKL